MWRPILYYSAGSSIRYLSLLTAASRKSSPWEVPALLQTPHQLDRAPPSHADTVLGGRAFFAFVGWRRPRGARGSQVVGGGATRHGGISPLFHSGDTCGGPQNLLGDSFGQGCGSVAAIGSAGGTSFSGGRISRAVWRNFFSLELGCAHSFHYNGWRFGSSSTIVSIVFLAKGLSQRGRKFFFGVNRRSVFAILLFRWQ